MKQHVSWWVNGHVHTRAALDEHAAAIRDLQDKVADLTTVATATLIEQVRAAVDDLGARIGALAERIDELEGERD